MEKQTHGLATGLLMSLATAATLSGCAVYAPPYTAYDAAPVIAPYYANPYAYGDGYGYGYGRPAYVGPPATLNFGYYHRSYRGGWDGHRGHGWRGNPGWRAPGGRGPGRSGAHGGRGGYRGGGHGRR